jgi:hypothetical protein
VLAPGSHVPVVPPSRLAEAPVDDLIVFSYGYLDEIATQVHEEVAPPPRLVSVLDVLAARA